MNTHMDICEEVSKLQELLALKTQYYEHLTEIREPSTVDRGFRKIVCIPYQTKKELEIIKKCALELHEIYDQKIEDQVDVIRRNI